MMSNDQTIKDRELPREILDDFQTFLAYVDQHHITLTKTREYMRRKHLREIYPLLENRHPTVSKDVNQDGYLMIHLYFQLAITLRLTYKKWSRDTMLLVTDPERAAAYRELNAAEQYVTLLHAFWTEVDWEDLQKSKTGKIPYNVDLLLEHVQKQPFGQTLQVAADKTLNRLLDSYENFLYYFDYLGFWEIEEVNMEKADYPREITPKSMTLMPRFKKMIPALLDTWGASTDLSDALDGLINLFGGYLDESKEDDEEEEPESLFHLLQPIFENGALQNILFPSGAGEMITGNVTVKVLLHSFCWRILRLPASATLQDLHDLIQKAFTFDDDHLYSFFMDGKRFSKNAYHSPMDMQGPYAREKMIGQLNYEGMRFLYLFDYGDEWMFHITVEEIAEGDEKPAAIVAEKGDAPDQYG